MKYYKKLSEIKERTIHKYRSCRAFAFDNVSRLKRIAKGGSPSRRVFDLQNIGERTKKSLGNELKRIYAV